VRTQHRNPVSDFAQKYVAIQESLPLACVANNCLFLMTDEDISRTRKLPLHIRSAFREHVEEDLIAAKNSCKLGLCNCMSKNVHRHMFFYFLF
jgi:hypothetical protein